MEIVTRSAPHGTGTTNRTARTDKISGAVLPGRTGRRDRRGCVGKAGNSTGIVKIYFFAAGAAGFAGVPLSGATGAAVFGIALHKESSSREVTLRLSATSPLSSAIIRSLTTLNAVRLPWRIGSAGSDGTFSGRSRRPPPNTEIEVRAGLPDRSRRHSRSGPPVSHACLSRYPSHKLSGAGSPKSTTRHYV